MTFVEFNGTARLDKRTKHLVKRLGPGDIAIIDHPNLDLISAEELLESGVRVVVNVSPSLTSSKSSAPGASIRQTPPSTSASGPALG